MPSSLWALEVKPGKVYKRLVEEPFRLSIAALGHDLNDASECRTSLAVSVNDVPPTIICTLIPSRIEQQTMDIVFDEGEDVAFSVIGENTIFLTGNMIPEEPYDLPPEDDSDEEEVDSGEEVSTDEDSEMEMEEEKVERLPNKPNLSKPQQCSVATVSPPETPKNNIKKPQTAVSTAKSVDEPPRKKQAVEPKAAEMEAEPAVRTLPSGLIIEDIQKGNGPRAKNGHRVSVRYIGKLSSGKLFDQNTKGKPFSFVLGKGECIKGWDLGVQGMQVGGTRRLTIPPQLAYGKRGAPPDIPSNAILKFDIKLLDTKGK